MYNLSLLCLLPPLLNARIISFSFFGNAFELYEFTVYAIFVPIFAKEFFVTTSETMSLIISGCSLATAFFTRPLGTFIFGYISDKLGRKVALSFSTFSMALTTLTVGLIPNYSEAGILAPIALICLRLFQGLSAGGEYNGAAIYFIEKFQYTCPGFISGIVTSSSMLGAIVGSIFGGWCLIHNMWRTAFIIGGLLGMLLFFLRFILTDSLTLGEKVKAVSRVNVFSGKYASKFFSNMLIGGLSGAYVSLFSFSSFYLTKYIGYSINEILTLNVAALYIYLVSNPLFGIIYDKIGSKNYWDIIFATNIVLLVVAYNIFNSGLYVDSFIAALLFGTQTASVVGPCHAFMQENIVPEIRYHFVSLSFSTGMALIGSITPALLIFLIEKYDALCAPYYWITTVMIITWLAIKCMNRQWKVG